MPQSESGERRPERWVVLAAYAFALAVTQMLWLNFGPLLSLVEARYGVGELAASLLVLVFPLLYVVFSVPAGMLIDGRGYRMASGIGAIATAVFAAVRIFDGTFWALLIGQLGIAVAQPFVMNGISKLVSDWFSEEQGAVATGLGTMGMSLGMAIGLAATPAMVSRVGLQQTMIAFTAIAVVAAVLFGIFVRPNDQRTTRNDLEASDGFRALVAQRSLRILFALSFLGIGVFNGLTTWLEQILAPRGIDAEQAGLVGGALIVGGIVGAVVVPALSDFTKRRKPFLMACAFAALATIYPLCMSNHYSWLLGFGALHGFFFMPAFALLLDMSAQIAGARSAGAATSLLMLTGNAGATLIVLAMPIIKGQGTDFHSAVLLLVGLLGITVILTLFVPETSVARREPV